jgi:hypothetical protein
MAAAVVSFRGRAGTGGAQARALGQVLMAGDAVLRDDHDAVFFGIAFGRRPG